MARPGATRASLLKFALSLPGAWEDHPWEETVVKVGKKIFVFLGGPGSTGMGVKLAESLPGALGVKDASPRAYGLGKWGWVNVPFGSDAPPLAVLKDWVEESYRLIAGKRLVAELDARGAATRR